MLKMIGWFCIHFIAVPYTPCREDGWDYNCTILLFLDNYFAHPPAEILLKIMFKPCTFPQM